MTGFWTHEEFLESSMNFECSEGKSKDPMGEGSQYWGLSYHSQRVWMSV